MSDTKKPETPDYVSMQRVDEIDAKLQQVLAHNPAPWRQVLPIMPYNVEDANGEDVALAQMQRVPGQTSCLTGAQARINLSALLGQTPTMLQPLMSGRLSGIFGIGPAAKPMTSSRPPQAMSRSASSV